MMQYEIAYVSLSGNTQRLAQEITAQWPAENISVTDLSQEKITGRADVYLLCCGVNKGTVPLAIMDALEDLHGKKILFFVTCGMEPTEEYRDAIQKRLLPFLPDDCDDCGLFLCQGEFPEEVILAAENKLSVEPENRYAKKILKDARTASGHPNGDDVEKARRFIQTHLLT